MRRGNSDPMTPEMEARIRALAAMPDETIDTSDIPEVLDWSDAVRGRFYRPVKRQLTLRLDADVVDFFEASGQGYQTRINAALREWVMHAVEKGRKAG
ncbi:BrnA antitoxin family protein [Leptolyngbya sp. 15MV]|jgi:uncharacterized protein (DUF4415 family)|nr:BrnA antitoxin family protein [Leptolyngbya sp. 15MV]